MKNVTRFSISVLLATLVLGFATKRAMAKDPAPVAAQERVRAKVGIEVRSGERSTPAKTTETIKEKSYQIDGSSKESITIICSPTEVQEVIALFRDAHVLPQGWPALEEDLLAKSKIELGQKVDSPIIITGRVAQKADEPLQNVLPQRWTALEEDLLAKSKMDLTAKADKPFQIAGNVRTMADKSFIDTIPIFSGKRVALH